MKMGQLIESLKKESGTDWKLEFPFHEVQTPMSDFFPSHDPDHAPVSPALIKKVSSIYSVFEKYMKKVDSAMKSDSNLKEHYEILKKVDESFKKLVSKKDKGDWVNVNARLSRAHNSLYR